MTVLIVSGFAEAQTAFLARAALARLQRNFALPARDVALVQREGADEVLVHEAVAQIGDVRTSVAFWKTLAGLLFVSEPPAGSGGEAVPGKLAALGIDRDSLGLIASRIRDCDAMLFVLIHDSPTRDKILGVLKGFDGEIVQANLHSEGGSVGRA